MRILIVHRYYWPDKSPCSYLMQQIAKHLVNEKVEVDVLSSLPSYHEKSQLPNTPKKEIDGGVKVHRLNLAYERNGRFRRIFNCLYLGLQTITRVIWVRYDLVIATTIPPILGGFFAVLAAKIVGARSIYFCMDLHPEVGRVSGDFVNPILCSILSNIDDWSCRHASLVLVHSSDMRNTLKARPRGAEYNIELMNNFSLPLRYSKDFGASNCMPDNRTNLTVVYAGNIGRFQGLDLVIESMARISSRPDISLILVGEGVDKIALKNKVAKTKANVKFIDYLDGDAQLASVLKQADIALVTLKAEMYKYAYPSKTMTYLGHGKPLIAIIEPESELAHDTRRLGYGFTVSPGDLNNFSDLLLKLAADGSWKQRMSMAALRVFNEKFSAEVVLPQWTKAVRNNTTYL